MTDTSEVKALLDGYVDDGKLPGYSVLISREGEEVAYHQHGLMDVERARPVARDTVFRIYSMTKPLASAALMQLFEQGKVTLDDPLHQFVPAFKEVEVFANGDSETFTTVKPERDICVRDLLTHTSGLSYGFNPNDPVDQMYIRDGIYAPPSASTQADRVQALATKPLCFSPGTRWNYSLATDVVGLLVEIISGKPLDEYLREHITGPLGMRETDFHVQPEQRDRFAACYQHVPANNTFSLQDDPENSRFTSRPALVSGGGGLVSTIDDYLVFCEAMLGGGERDGVRILKQKTVAQMATNHLPEGKDLGDLGQSVFLETTMDGVGFGLGYAVVLDPERAGVLASPGELSWGGMASTYHFIDPVKRIIVVFMTQLIPSSSYPIRTQMKNAIYKALEV